MTDREQVWLQNMSASLSGLMIGRSLPLDPSEDFHFIENAVAICARFADKATEQWAVRFAQTPEPKALKKARKSND